jgi:hypothetical protein
MSQDNTPFGERPQPRYQPPVVGGGAGVVNSNNGTAARPGDWPAPDYSSTGQGAWGSYQPGGYNYPAGYGYTPPMNVNPPTPEDPQAAAYKRAAKIVEAKLKFYKHLTIYLIINGFLWFIALVGSSGGVHAWKLWPIWITVFWGIGLFSEWRRVFGDNERRRQEMIEEELRRMNRF